MAGHSLWRQESRKVIEAVLASIPAGASEKEVRKALRVAYPFGPRENHPYKMWRVEVREAVERRFPTRWPSLKPQVRWGVMDWQGKPWLYVYCPWCFATPPPACLMCGQHFDRLKEAVRDPQFQALRACCCKEDPLARVALSDWLEEHIGERL